MADSRAQCPLEVRSLGETASGRGGVYGDGRFIKVLGGCVSEVHGHGVAVYGQRVLIPVERNLGQGLPCGESEFDLQRGGLRVCGERGRGSVGGHVGNGADHAVVCCGARRFRRGWGACRRETERCGCGERGRGQRGCDCGEKCERRCCARRVLHHVWFVLQFAVQLDSSSSSNTRSSGFSEVT